MLTLIPPAGFTDAGPDHIVLAQLDIIAAASGAGAHAATVTTPSTIAIRIRRVVLIPHLLVRDDVLSSGKSWIRTVQAARWDANRNCE